MATDGIAKIGNGNGWHCQDRRRQRMALPR
nr:MAG TPA: hypothetical protein [Caudoviricetes sp.]